MKFAAILQVILLLGATVLPEGGYSFVVANGPCGAGCQCSSQKVKTNTCCCSNNQKPEAASCCSGSDDNCSLPELPACCQEAAANAAQADRTDSKDNSKSCCQASSKAPTSPWGQITGCPCGRESGSKSGLMMPRLLSERANVCRYPWVESLAVTDEGCSPIPPKPVTPPPQFPVC